MGIICTGTSRECFLARKYCSRSVKSFVIAQVNRNISCRVPLIETLRKSTAYKLRPRDICRCSKSREGIARIVSLPSQRKGDDRFNITFGYVHFLNPGTDGLQLCACQGIKAC